MDKEQRKRKAVVIGICALLVILIALAVIIVFLLINKDEDKEPKSNDTYVIDEGNYTQIKDEMDNRVQEGYFETYMTTDWIFPDGNSEATEALLGNSPNNVKPIRCEVMLEDTGELLFSTGVIPVGAQIPSIKLDVDLDAGVYDAVCMIYLLDEMEDGTYQDYSNAGFDVTITVQN